MDVASPGITPAARRVAIAYEGRELHVRPGVTIAAALADAGILACRTTPAGDRGVFCGMGVCGECLVQVQGAGERLACMTEVAQGMRLARQPARAQQPPAVDLDRAPIEHGLEPSPDAVLEPECLVIGGGPAGLAAGIAAAEAGVRTVLIDERARAGGQYFKQPAKDFGLDPRRLDAQFRAGAALIERARRSGLEIHEGVQVWGADGAGELYAAGLARRFVLRPRRLVLATGAYERAVPFPGWTLPGVITTGAGQSLLRSYQTAPGRRVLVAGNGPLNLQLAAELRLAGAEIVALVELGPVLAPARARHAIRMAVTAPELARDGLRYGAVLARARTPVLTGSTVIAVTGEDRAEHAIVARIDPAGRPVRGSERSFDVDAVCIGMGFMPGNEIARLLGAEHRADLRTGGYAVSCGPGGRTSLPHVWAVGDGATIRGAKIAEAAGTEAGLEVARSLGRAAAPRALRTARRHRRRHARFQGALWAFYDAPAMFAQLATPETIVCRCESVRLADVDAAAGEVASAGPLKRLTRAGMGRCQGRFCGFVIAARIAERTGTAVDVRSGFAPQLPFRPLPAAALAAPAPEQAGAASPGAPARSNREAG